MDSLNKAFVLIIHKNEIVLTFLAAISSVLIGYLVTVAMRLIMESVFVM